MNVKNLNTVIVTLLLLSLFFIIGCETSVRVNVMRPAELDLNGAKTISVLPIRTSSSLDTGSITNGTIILISEFFNFFSDKDPQEVKTAEYLESLLVDGLSSSPYINLIDSSRVMQSLTNNDVSPADVYFTGKITRFNTKIDTFQKVTKLDDDTKVKVDYYVRKVSFTFKYQIVDSKTSKVISYRSVDKDMFSSDCETMSTVPDAFPIIKSYLYTLSEDILHQLQPYEEVKYIYLLSDSTKNPDMKSADELVKNDLISEGCDLFLKIYNREGLFEAGYNAAMLLEAQGLLIESEEILSELAISTGDKRAYNALNDVRAEISDSKELEKQTMN